jgi:hypothetical protein
VTAGVDAFLDTAAYPSGVFGVPLRAIVDRVLPSVRESDAALDRAHGAAVRECAGYRAALIETAVAVNAGLIAMTLQSELSERLPQELGIVFGVYDLATHRVGLPGAGRDDAVALLAPPRDATELPELSTSIAASPTIAALLDA